MTFADLQFVCLLSFTDAPEDDLAIWVGVISLHVKHLLLPQGFDSPVGPQEYIYIYVKSIFSSRPVTDSEVICRRYITYIIMKISLIL